MDDVQIRSIEGQEGHDSKMRGLRLFNLVISIKLQDNGPNRDELLETEQRWRSWLGEMKQGRTLD